jgi:hypothetical protein
MSCIAGAFLPEKLVHMGAPCFLPFGMVFLLLLFWEWRSRRIARAWFQRNIIDRAKRDNTPIHEIVKAFREVERRPPGSGNARSLLRYTNMLERMVCRQFKGMKNEPQEDG